MAAGMAPFLEGGGRSLCLVCGVGDRPDRHIADTGRAVAHVFDRYLCFEREDYRRGRAPGEIASRLADALEGAGVSSDRIDRRDTLPAALEAAVGLVQPGDLLVIFGTDVRTSLPLLRSAFALRRGLSPG